MLAAWCIGIGLFFAALWLVSLVSERVFPHDPPPLVEGESTASRLGKLHW